MVSILLLDKQENLFVPEGPTCKSIYDFPPFNEPLHDGGKAVINEAGEWVRALWERYSDRRAPLFRIGADIDECASSLSRFVATRTAMGLLDHADRACRPKGMVLFERIMPETSSWVFSEYVCFLKRFRRPGVKKWVASQSELENESRRVLRSFSFVLSPRDLLDLDGRRFFSAVPGSFRYLVSLARGLGVRFLEYAPFWPVYITRYLCAYDYLGKKPSRIKANSRERIPDYDTWVKEQLVELQHQLDFEISVSPDS